MPLDIGDIPIGAEDFWLWFQFTGSCVVWVVTFGHVWLMKRHKHRAGFIGLMLHVAVIGGGIYFSDVKRWDKATPELGKDAPSTAVS